MLVEINDKWVQRITSPMGYVAGVLAGISITFAPMFLYISGKSMEEITAGFTVVIFCMPVILFCGFFHYILAQEVMAQVHEAKKTGLLE